MEICRPSGYVPFCEFLRFAVMSKLAGNMNIGDNTLLNLLTYSSTSFSFRLRVTTRPGKNNNCWIHEDMNCCFSLSVGIHTSFTTSILLTTGPCFLI
jgi:hypothetical protein